jgi:hypothetical protein
MTTFVERNGVRLLAILPILGLAIMLSCTPKPNPNTGPTPPTPKTGEGPVAFLTADDTSLTVGQTTTARLWVQQSSPNVANDNGIFSVAVNVEANPAGIVQSQVPVTILTAWSNPTPAANTGTATIVGGIDKVTAGVDITAGNKTEGISGPVEVFNFQVRAVGAGTVTLAPTNDMTGGFKGVLDYKAQTGDESKYVSVQITVQ